MPRRLTHCEPLGIVIDTQPEGREHTAIAEKINGSNLFRQHKRIAHRQDGDTHAKFDALGAAGDHGQARDRLESWRGIADAVIEPDRIEAAFFHQINKIPKITSALERPTTKAYADADFHRDLPVMIESEPSPAVTTSPPPNWRGNCGAQHLAWKRTCLLEPGAVSLIEQWGNSLLNVLVIACKPGTLGVRKLRPVDQPLIEGDERQGFELQPAFATRVGRHVVVWHNHIEILKADTAPAFLVIARLIGHYHARLQRLIATAWADALRPFVDVEKGPNTVASAVPVVETSIPHASTRQPIQHHTTRAFREFLPGQSDMTAQDQGVEATLPLRRRADADGAGVIGGATEHLHARVDQKKLAVA